MFSHKHCLKTHLVQHAELRLQTYLIRNKRFRNRYGFNIHFQTHTMQIIDLSTVRASGEVIYLYPLYRGFLTENFPREPYSKSRSDMPVAAAKKGLLRKDSHVSALHVTRCSITNIVSRHTWSNTLKKSCKPA